MFLILIAERYLTAWLSVAPESKEISEHRQNRGAVQKWRPKSESVDQIIYAWGLPSRALSQYFLFIIVLSPIILNHPQDFIAWRGWRPCVWGRKIDFLILLGVGWELPLCGLRHSLLISLILSLIMVSSVWKSV